MKGMGWFGLDLFGCVLDWFGLHFCLIVEMYKLGSTPGGEMQLASTPPYPHAQIFLGGEWWVQLTSLVRLKFETNLSLL